MEKLRQYFASYAQPPDSRHIDVLDGLLTLKGLRLIYEKNKAEKEERMAVDFAHEMDKIHAETPQLCEKYKLTSLDENVAVPVAWQDDSLRYCQQLTPFFGMEGLLGKAMAALNDQKQAIAESRQHDFDSLLMLKIFAVPDSITAAANQSL